jgi:hypothetical protein
VVQISAINPAGTSTVNLVIDVTGQEFLVDFGTTPTTNALSGKIWNNWTNGGQVLSNIVASSGTSTGYTLYYNTDVSWNTGFGVLPNPALGVFNEANVLIDGVYTTSSLTNGATLTIAKLNPNNAYTLQLFGSRDATETRATLYTLTGANTVSGTLTNSGMGLGGPGTNYNNSNILTFPNLHPSHDGLITLNYKVTQGGFGYLNALRVTTTNYPSPASTYLALANRWTDQNALSPEPGNAVLFLGSSSIRRWESLTRDFADYKVIQHGMGGAVFADINQLLDSVATSCNPRALVVWAGVNDLYADRSADYVFEQFKTFVDSVAISMPSTKIFYIGMTRNPEFVFNAARDTERLQANSLIANYVASSGNPNLIYIDLPAFFEPLTYTTTQVTSNPAELWYYQVDTAHLNKAGYSIWKNQIRSALAANGILPDRIPISDPLAPAVGKKILFDFGPADVTNGDATSGPDILGNYWNNWHSINGSETVVAGERKANLVDSDSSSTGVSLTITGDFKANGKANGGLSSLPSQSLGDLGILSAAQDYFYCTSDAMPGGGDDNVLGGFRISGLNPKLIYDLKFLASCSVASTRQTRFEVYGTSSVSATTQSSGTGIGSNGGNGNDTNVTEVKSVQPNAFGDIFVDVSALSQASSTDVVAYINAMEIIVVSPFEAWARSQGLASGLTAGAAFNATVNGVQAGLIYAFGSSNGSPQNNGVSAFPVMNGTQMSYTFDVVNDPVLIVSYQTSTDLLNWSSAQLVSAETGISPIGFLKKKVQVAGVAKLFLRINVTHP